MAQFSDRPLPRDGDRVTVVIGSRHPSSVRRDHVVIVGHGRKRSAWSPVGAIRLTSANEGTEWARGWEGVDVDALRVAVAL